MTIADRTLVEMFETMTRIRLFEERVTLEYQRGDMPGFRPHLHRRRGGWRPGCALTLRTATSSPAPTEATGTASPRDARSPALLAELYGRETGLCKGRGGSMHIADFEIGMLGANAIVGGSIGLATGGAFAQQVKGTSNVSVSFFGDGGSGQGILYESMNLASIWKLPVIYVCENNGWGGVHAGLLLAERRGSEPPGRTDSESPAGLSTARMSSPSTRQPGKRSSEPGAVTVRRSSRRRSRASRLTTWATPRSTANEDDLLPRPGGGTR